MKARLLKPAGGVTIALLLASLQFPAAAAESGLRVLPQEGAHFSRTVKVGPSGALDLSNVSGNIDIRGGSGDAIAIEATKRGNPSSVSIDVSQTGNRVRVETRNAKGRKGTSVDFTVTVPSGTAVSAQSVSGNVNVHDVGGEVRAESVSGEVTLGNLGNLVLAKSVSGDLEIQSTKSEEDLELSTVSGGLRVGDLNARAVMVRSVSGDVTLTGADCERAAVQSVSGTIRYGGDLAANGRYEFESHSGDVRIQIAEGAGFELAAQSFSGEIESELPVTLSSGRARGGELHGVHGNGSALIEATTFSGDVSIVRD